MFTGLIVEMGEILSVVRKDGGAARLILASRAVSADAGIGDSISINGTCLTVVEKKGVALSFDLSDETLRSTNLGRLRVKDKVNLEPSLRPDSKLGGHFVTGHIDGVGTISSKGLSGDVYRIMINTGERLAGFLVDKGSVAVDGISLTVVEALPDGFTTVIIPHTAKMTTLGLKGTGDLVNIEVDILGKYVSKFLGKQDNSRLMRTLEREGFV